MARWHATLEYFQFPLKVLFFATFLLGVGSSIINPNVSYIWEVDNPTVILISELMRYGGGFLIRVFPLLVFLKILTRKFEDSVPVFIGFVSYIIMNVIVLFIENTGAASYFYGNMMGIQISFQADSLFGEITRIPYNTGILGLLLCYFITTRCYQKSRHYTMHGILSFIDHDTWAMILSFFFSILAGIAVSYIWPFVIMIIEYIYEYLSSDMSNPMNLFLYGMMERISAVFGLSDLPREAFWFSELGGSATDNFGVLYSGDVNTWFAMQNLNIVTTNAGHLITPYYVINIFLIPSFLLGYYSMVSDTRDRRRYFMFFLLAIALSIICGNALPMEIFMLILSPMLYVLYLLLVGLMFAGFQMLGVSIGYIFNGSVMVANPGSLLDLFQYFRNPDMMYSLSTLASFGIVVFILFFFATRGYFRKYAIGLFNLSDRKKVTGDVVRALGGYANITRVSSTPDKLTVGLQNRTLVNFEELRELGAYLILESKEGYLIRLGNISTIVACELKKTMKEEQSK